MNKLIESIRVNNTGSFLPDEISDTFSSMDGSDVADWLESQGYNVINYFDTGRNGLATTTCGMSVSTNGYCHPIKGKANKS